MRIQRMVAVGVLMLSLGAVSSFARPQPVAIKIGRVSALNPAGNNGGRFGAGFIREEETGTRYVFQTPEDVRALPLAEGMHVSFESGDGHQATNIFRIE